LRSALPISGGASPGGHDWASSRSETREGMAQAERLELVEAMWETHESPAAWLGALSEAFERAVPELLAPTAFHGVVEDMQMRMMAAAAPPRASHLPIVLASAAETPPELIMKTHR